MMDIDIRLVFIQLGLCMKRAERGGNLSDSIFSLQLKLNKQSNYHGKLYQRNAWISIW
jgi:hypothetical protein